MTYPSARSFWAHGQRRRSIVAIVGPPAPVVTDTVFVGTGGVDIVTSAGGEDGGVSALGLVGANF